MKLLTFMKISLALGFALPASFATAETLAKKQNNDFIVNDSLVTNLRCNMIKNDSSTFTYIDPKKAFHTFRHFPVKNWEFDAGVANLGNCWSLSRSQRLFFYLARFNEVRPSADSHLKNTLDMIRGSVPRFQKRLQDAGAPQSSKVEIPFTNYQVFHINDSSLKQSYLNQLAYGKGFWNEITKQKIFKNEIDGTSFARSFKSEIEHYQAGRFFKLSNLGMATGSSTGTPQENYSLARKLISDLQFNRLPLVNLRYETTAQHIVLIKSFVKELNGDITFNVYDSNDPYNEQSQLRYLANKGKFIAPIIFAWMPYPQKELGVFNVDNEEIPEIGRALKIYYQTLCQSIRQRAVK